MNSSNLATAVLSIVLLAVGGFAWSLQLQPALEIDASALATLPAQIEIYEGHEIPLESTVESILRADGALIRISTPLSGGDVIGAHGRLLGFASVLDPLLAERWPTESEAS
jgi:hypothetical protein